MYALVTYLLQPLTLLCLATGLGLLVLWRGRPEARRRLRWVAVPFLALVALSLPAVAHPALGTLEWQYPPLEELPDDAGAIVVLGGGVLPPGGPRKQAEPAPDSLYRCLRAAELYHRRKGGCPVLVTGGKVDPHTPGPAVADVMGDFLVTLGVAPADLIRETASRTTHENAVESGRLLEERGVRKVVLVTEAIHMLRSERCFHRQGIEVVPAACQYRATRFEPSPSRFLPNASAALHLQEVSHEWLGLAWYWLQGRI